MKRSAILLLLVFPLICFAEEKNNISQEKAIQIAKEACAGKQKIPSDAPIDVTLKDNLYTVTFKAQWSEGVLGGDYHAQVTIDAKSGQVIKILGSD